MYYSAGDFIKAPKCDAHIHYNMVDDTVMKYAVSVNMRILTINTDLSEPTIDKQLKIALTLKEKYPGWFDFLGTFDASKFESTTFSTQTIAHLKKTIDEGAVGIKIWKNIGMDLRDTNGQYIMADHHAFAPIYKYLEKNRIPLLTHLGEPRNCWLPYHEITTKGDLRYYKKHRKYHMYQHPEVPTYEQQIAARDHILEHYPQLQIVGAHLGSMEWDLCEVEKRFELFPNFCIDLSGRMEHIQLQASQNPKKVRDFFIKYQDRIMYGSDWDVTGRNKRTWLRLFHKCFPRIYKKMLFTLFFQTWRTHWIFLATDTVAKNTSIAGLHLPKSVINKIFHGNAVRIYHLPEPIKRC